MQKLLGILTWEPNVKMQYEFMLILLFFLCVSFGAETKKQLRGGLAAVFCLFLYLHRILLPFFVSGFYVWLLGGICCVLFTGRPSAFLAPGRRLCRILLELTEIEETEKGAQRSGAAKSGRSALLPVLVIAAVLLIQLCRINIAYDYDSLRYGLRSDLLLLGDGGLRSFFDGQGLVNTVYTYPKGFELLTLPLCFGHTYGHVLSFNVWMLIIALILTGALAREAAGAERAGLLAACAAALMPGITNMAVTAKTDLATLCCQLTFVYAVLRYLRMVQPGSVRKAERKPKKRERCAAEKCGGEPYAAHTAAKTAGAPDNVRGALAAVCGKRDAALCAGDYVGIGAAALVFSYTLKPTAYLFSTMLGIFALGFLLYTKRRIVISACAVRLVVLSALFLALITVRTWVVSGLPLTCVFSGVFTSLGMELSYPFAPQSLPSGSPSAALGFTEAVRQFLCRLAGSLFLPLGDDLSHVWMAWGGIFVVWMIAVLLRKGRTSVRAQVLLSRYAALTGGNEADEAAESKEACRAVCVRLRSAGAGKETVSGNANGESGAAAEEALESDKTAESGADALRCLYGLCALIGGLSLLSLALLYQVDGNYYMLLYALLAAGGTSALWLSAAYKASPLSVAERGKTGLGVLRDNAAARFGQARGAATAQGVSSFFSRLAEDFGDGEAAKRGALCAAVCLMLYVTMFTGWAGAVGFTPIDPINRGYYNHEVEEGWMTAPDGRRGARVIAFAKEPECYRIRARVESWTDLDGSGGNVYLTDTKLNIFKEYCSFAQIDYFYIDTDWLYDTSGTRNPRSERARTLFWYLLEDGAFDEIYVIENSSHEIWAHVDRERMAVGWEVPMGEAREARTEEQTGRMRAVCAQYEETN